MEIDNLIPPLQQSLLEAISGPEVILQEIGILVQRRPSRRSVLLTKLAPALEAALARDRLHDVERIVLAHHGETHVECLVCLSAFRDCFAQLHDRTRCLIQPFSAASYRKPNQLRNTHPKCLHSRLSPREHRRLAKQLGIHCRRPTTGCRSWTIDVTNITNRKRFGLITLSNNFFFHFA